MTRRARSESVGKWLVLLGTLDGWEGPNGDATRIESSLYLIASPPDFSYFGCSEVPRDARPAPR